MCRRRCRIKLAVTLLDPSGTHMALHCDSDMVRAIVGACQVKLLSGPAGSQGQDALAGNLGALISRPAASLAVALDVRLRPRLAVGAFASAAVADWVF